MGDEKSGYRKWMLGKWKNRGNFECTEKRICYEEKQIIDKKLFAEAKIQVAKKLAEKDEIETLTPETDVDNPP